MRALLPDTQVIGIPPGVPARLPDDASILVAAPIVVRGATAPEHSHAGLWLPPPLKRPQINSRVAARIANDLDVLIRRVAIDRFERIFGLDI
ncbi:hypothetical protein HDG40_002072 [Paraburkholderia sp. JPY158]|uniref:Uncharacterized protein n=1 Tax=Paraburkholderia atlantica TaxID=2654982 RepID=A0A7W8Q535_PARAM|nr:hypothetical protein [Paraburkholderia atlantica]MBB5423928.1 hypothetical protein [Paraburkholderia atlantica]